MKKYSGPGTPMGRLNVIEQVVWEERRRNPSPVTACDGCFRRFHGAPAEEKYDDEDAGDAGDAGDPFKRCTECDYTICEDCTHPEMQGMFLISWLPSHSFPAEFVNPVQACRTLTAHLVLVAVKSPILALAIAYLRHVTLTVMVVSHIMATDILRWRTMGMTKMHSSRRSDGAGHAVWLLDA